MVVPQCQPQPIVKLRLTQFFTRVGQTIGMDRTLPVEQVILATTGEPRYVDPQIGEVKNIELTFLVVRIPPTTAVNAVVRNYERKETFRVTYRNL